MRKLVGLFFSQSLDVIFMGPVLLTRDIRGGVYLTLSNTESVKESRGREQLRLSSIPGVAKSWRVEIPLTDCLLSLR